jgi:hypothetical protein
MQAIFDASARVMPAQADEWELWPVWRDMLVDVEAAKRVPYVI